MLELCTAVNLGQVSLAKDIWLLMRLTRLNKGYKQYQYVLIVYILLLCLHSTGTKRALISFFHACTVLRETRSDSIWCGSGDVESEELQTHLQNHFESVKNLRHQTHW